LSRQVTLTPKAVDDLTAIGDRIALDSPAAAANFIRRLRAQCDRLARYPEARPRAPKLGPGIRFAVVGNYLVLFRVEPDRVTIVRILHGARDIVSVLSDDG